MTYATTEDLEIEKTVRADEVLKLRKRINLLRNTLTPRIDSLESISITGGNQTIYGIKTFTDSPLVPNVDDNDSPQTVINKQYCDTKINNLVGNAPSALDTLNELSNALQNDSNFASNTINLINTKTTLNEVQSNNNIWTGSNAFNTFLPTSILTPVNAADLTPKSYIDNQITNINNVLNTKTTLTNIQENNNVWTGSNAFNTFLPTSTLTPSTNNQLTTKSYVDAQVSTRATLSQVQSNNNNWTGINNFSILPTVGSGLTGTPTLNEHLTSKLYVDGQLLTKGGLSVNNAWTALNSFANLPTFSGATAATAPTGPNQFTPKAYVDAQVATRGGLTGANTWTGTNSFSNLPTFSGAAVPSLSNHFTTKAYVDSQDNQISSQISSQVSSQISSSTVDLTTTQSVGGIKMFARIGEQITQNASSSTSYSISYVDNSSVVNITNPPATNFAVSIQNIPNSGSVSSMFTLTLVITATTNKVYANSITVNGSSVALMFNSGSGNISVSSANIIIQTLTIMMMSGSPSAVFSSVNAFY